MEQDRCIVAPHFKGIINWRDMDAYCLLQRMACDGAALAPGSVCDLLEECPITVATTFRRTIAAGLYALKLKRTTHQDPRLCCVEGCPHRMGTTVLRGAQLTHHLWEQYIPGVFDELRAPMLDYYSDCTARECRRLFEHTRSGGALTVVTDAYQQPRSEAYLAELAAQVKRTVRFHVLTPEEIRRELSWETPGPQRFFYGRVVDLVSRRFAKEGVIAREMRAERWYRRLHRLSGILRFFAPSFDLERRQAARVRSDERLRRVLFDDGAQPTAPCGGLPLRELDRGTSDFFART